MRKKEKSNGKATNRTTIPIGKRAISVFRDKRPYAISLGSTKEDPLF